MNNLLTIVALTLQIILLIYFGVTSMVSLFPFNGVRFRFTREGRAAQIAHYGDSVANTALMAVAPVGFILRGPSLMRFGIAYYLVFIAVQVPFWWLPYYLGPSSWWLNHYTKIHRETITVLPRRGTNPVPNLEHLTLQCLIVLTTAVTLIAYRVTPSAQFPHSFWTSLAEVGAVLVGLTAVKNIGNAGKGQPNSNQAPVSLGEE